MMLHIYRKVLQHKNTSLEAEHPDIDDLKQTISFKKLLRHLYKISFGFYMSVVN